MHLDAVFGRSLPNDMSHEGSNITKFINTFRDVFMISEHSYAELLSLWPGCLPSLTAMQEVTGFSVNHFSLLRWNLIADPTALTSR